MLPFCHCRSAYADALHPGLIVLVLGLLAIGRQQVKAVSQKGEKRKNQGEQY